MKNHNKTIPSILLILDIVAQSISISFAKTHVISAANRLNGISFKTVFFWTLIGQMIAAIHKISSIFTILLHNILPIAISELLFSDARIFTTNSGAEVPKATIVDQITIFEMLNFFAIADDQSTSKSAHLINRKNPIINRIYII